MAEHASNIRVANPPPRPLLIFDGDCGFCRAWIARWKAVTGERVDYASSQEVGASYPEIPGDAFKKSVQLVETDGSIRCGAEAVYRALTYASGNAWLFWLYHHLPGFALISEMAYAFVASHRSGLSRLTRWLWGAHLEPSTFLISRWIFLRALAVVYLIAIISYWVQADGLIGDHGVLPLREHLDYSRLLMPDSYWWRMPTLLWLWPTSSAVNFLCGAGVIFSLLLLFNLAPIFCLPALWAIYLSLVHAGQDFYYFQWDILLIETGFLAIFLAPLGWRPGLAQQSPPSGIALFLVKWLLFRLMFSSGMVKLLSEDLTWWSLAALKVHYETQPLPTWTSWYVHQLPEWFHVFSCAAMFVIELIVPFLIFGPRRMRHFAATLLITLQILIAASGNYAFFNVLTIVLCIPLLDDWIWPQRLRNWLNRTATPAKVRAWPRWVLAPIAIMIFFIGGVRMLERWRVSLPSIVRRATDWESSLLTVSAYGLFAQMTTERLEIVIEGSDDGKTWHEYEFKYKPGDLKRRPTFIAPYQPRLDWQMWFAALDNAQNNPWFLNLLERILDGSPSVLASFEKNPFPDKPPQLIRAILYRYRFTDSKSGADGSWWQREYKRIYVPPVALKN